MTVTATVHSSKSGERDREVVAGFASFVDAAPIPNVLASEWELWFAEHFQFSPLIVFIYNLLFIIYLLFYLLFLFAIFIFFFLLLLQDRKYIVDEPYGFIKNNPTRIDLGTHSRILLHLST